MSRAAAVPFAFLACLAPQWVSAQSLLPSSIALPASPGPEPASGLGVQGAAASSAGTPNDQLSLGALVRELGRNLRRLPSIETAGVLGVGGGLSAWVRSEDAEITHRWSGSPELDRVFEPGDVMGSGWIHMGGAVGTYALGRGRALGVSGNRRAIGAGSRAADRRSSERSARPETPSPLVRRLDTAPVYCPGPAA